MIKIIHKVIKSILICLFVLPTCFYSVANTDYRFKTVAGDPIETHIYELENGLKVYLTVNDLEPRIQTAIAVRMGSKHDPKDDTGSENTYRQFKRLYKKGL